MSIQINQTYGRIGIETTPAKLNITTQNADLQLQHENVVVNMHTELPRVVISNRECFNTSGSKDLESFAKEASQLGKSAASKYISKVVGDGNSYVAIENGSNPLPSIVIRDAYPQHEFNIDSIPKARPEIQIVGGTQVSSPNALSGNNGIHGTYNPGKVNFDVLPSNVRIFMLQNPSLDIKYVGRNVDVYK